MHKTIELPLPEDDAQQRWAEFERSRAELAGIAEATFEPVEDNRTRVTIAGDSPSVEGTVDEFRQFVEKTVARPGG